MLLLRAALDGNILLAMQEVKHRFPVPEISPLELSDSAAISIRVLMK
jgi:hypothetical protein